MEKYGVVQFEVGCFVVDSKYGKGRVVFNNGYSITCEFNGTKIKYTIDGLSDDGTSTIEEC